MAVNNRTTNRDYPKPNVANLLSEDVVRLSEALDDIDADVAALQSKAPAASPTFTGTPAAPTAAVDTNTVQVATTAFVLGQASAANPVINGTAAAGSSLRFARADHIHPVDTTRAPVASPTFTGTPAAPTPAADTSTTQLATTAYVVGQNYTKQTRTVFAGTGLTGGGDLSANRTIAADVATQAEAEAGTSSTKLMTPERVAQAISTAGQTLTDPVIVGTILEDVFTITDGAAFEVDPGNGSVQLITLGASRTPKATNFAAGESITLMVNDGTAYTLTWTDATWGAGGVKWVGGIAPTLATSGYSVIQFWKVSTQVYGAYVGGVA
jgi:hypothetical protein